MHIDLCLLSALESPWPQNNRALAEGTWLRLAIKANPLPFWPCCSELKVSVQNDNTRSASRNDRQHLLSLVSTLYPRKALILKLVRHPGVPLWSSDTV